MSGKTVLVVGGAGYIGSHTCLALSERGYQPVVFDNYVNGHRECVQWGPAIEGDIRDYDAVHAALRDHKPEAIIHFAGLIEVGQSTRTPTDFYQNNVAGTLNVLAAAKAEGVDKLVFSSTCATYGLPATVPITEQLPQKPINPYGRTKLAAEFAILDACAYEGMHAVILRYFNAAGADFKGRIGEWHEPESHVIPLAIDVALGRREHFSVFGRDYDTRDGTCVRDYIHVLDLADAHVRAVDYLMSGGKTAAANLGTGHGTTVLELIDAIERKTGKPLAVKEGERREGDPPVLVADNRMALDVLGWAPRYTLDDIIASAYRWHEANPRS